MEIKPESTLAGVFPKPPWLRKKHLFAKTVSIKKELREKNLHTVCESARCPNISECFKKGTATMMILGDTCTRNCGFCAVSTGKSLLPDEAEPKNVAEMINRLKLRHAVITSVTRDDLPDGGAEHFAKTVREIRNTNSNVIIELLIPDFAGNRNSLDTVLKEKPDILNHNIETVPSLYHKVRPQADFYRSLEIIRYASKFNVTTKSGIMVGFGEHDKELIETMEKLYEAGTNILTIGQYLPPSRHHLPVVKYFTEGWFKNMEDIGLSIGIKKVFAGPYVRSSYMAEMVAK